ncbi:SNF2 family N-terminal domain-containing protein [Chaetomium sp. MPI-SDFR-AT-0129]|nr:SNF2 family N-terminal domain-containing protein [Chaetomium sp. MPI-SDFR-AT-0129]
MAPPPDEAAGADGGAPVNQRLEIPRAQSSDTFASYPTPPPSTRKPTSEAPAAHLAVKRKGDNGAESSHDAKRHQPEQHTGSSQEPQPAEPYTPVKNRQDNEISMIPGEKAPDTTLSQPAGLGHSDGAGHRTAMPGQDTAHGDDPKAEQDRKELEKAVASFGPGQCKQAEGKWRLDGFGTSLYDHQVIGVSWMLSREHHDTAPQGGILADEMGLGKTVQVLACMSQNKPPKRAKQASTLIIMPKRLLEQWEEEIKKHLVGRSWRGALIYSAKKGLKKAEMEKFKIILTNYAQVQRQLPSGKRLAEVEKLKQDGDVKWKSVLKQHCKGPLFEIEWFRVVLDEAHYINNRDSKTSRACRLLCKKYSWALTGTPMTNKTDELFPYLDFVRSMVEGYGDFLASMGDTGDEKQKAQLRATYNGMSLKRCADDRFMGRPIPPVPERQPPEVLTVKFSPLDQQIHNRFQTELIALREMPGNHRPPGRIRELFNSMRFFPSHPALIDPDYLSTPLDPVQAQRDPEVGNGDGVAYEGSEDSNNPESTPGIDLATSHPEDVKSQDSAGDRMMIHKGTADRKDTDTEKTPGHTEGENTSTPQRQHGHLHYFCRACRNALSGPHMTECGHVFCKHCLAKLLKKSGKCPACDRDLTNGCEVTGGECYNHSLNYFKTNKRDFGKKRLDSTKENRKRVRKPGDDELGNQPRLNPKTQSSKARRGGRKRTAKGKKGAVKVAGSLKRVKRNAGAFLRECDKTPWEPIPHCAKTKAAIDLILKWHKEAPDDKIIVFAQWIPILAILGRMVFQNGFKFVYLWGEMNPIRQDMCIRAFQEDPDINILLISVTCGAHGLNLTVANRVIMFDHWWHEGWERQAFARVHRIGQHKQVRTARLLVAGSMDEKVLNIQARKREAIAAAVGSRRDDEGCGVTVDEIYEEIVGEMGDIPREELAEVMELTRSRRPDVSDGERSDDEDDTDSESDVEEGGEEDPDDEDYQNESGPSTDGEPSGDSSEDDE